MKGLYVCIRSWLIHHQSSSIQKTKTNSFKKSIIQIQNPKNCPKKTNPILSKTKTTNPISVNFYFIQLSFRSPFLIPKIPFENKSNPIQSYKGVRCFYEFLNYLTTYCALTFWSPLFEGIFIFKLWYLLSNVIFYSLHLY